MIPLLFYLFILLIYGRLVLVDAFLVPWQLIWRDVTHYNALRGVERIRCSINSEYHKNQQVSKSTGVRSVLKCQCGLTTSAIVLTRGRQLSQKIFPSRYSYFYR